MKHYLFAEIQKKHFWCFLKRVLSKLIILAHAEGVADIYVRFLNEHINRRIISTSIVTGGLFRVSISRNKIE